MVIELLELILLIGIGYILVNLVVRGEGIDFSKHHSGFDELYRYIIEHVLIRWIKYYRTLEKWLLLFEKPLLNTLSWFIIFVFIGLVYMVFNYVF